MAVFLIWVIAAYRTAPQIVLWNAGVAGRYVPLVLMPFAAILVVLGLTTRNVTAVGGEHLANAAAQLKGAVTISRHPFLWGAALWALSHLVPNGDLASLLLFGGIAILSLGGMIAIDRKRSHKLGAAWQTIDEQTSAIPFAAALSGRRAVDWSGIGWIRPAAGLALYVVLLFAHPWIIGVSALPQG
jgi:uncharacterized membrane protein